MLRNSSRAFRLTETFGSSSSRAACFYVRGPAVLSRCRTITTTNASEIDQRKRLTSELKDAMKSKNTFASTVLRSVLAEVYSADKNPSGPISSSQIISILRKAVTRRTDSAVQFSAASRPELAETEKREADYLAALLPPLMSEADIDTTLQKLADEHNLPSPAWPDPKRSIGLLSKAFFSQVDGSLVDSQTVRKRAQAILESRVKKDQ
ncbi:Yqey-like protein-domain-containing protein [Phellopilus nigrolimitatus]|nr:Yqey-like protein-domain-containing protein [Phellopilus nigrolimitatus]